MHTTQPLLDSMVEMDCSGSRRSTSGSCAGGQWRTPKEQVEDGSPRRLGRWPNSKCKGEDYELHWEQTFEHISIDRHKNWSDWLVRVRIPASEHSRYCYFENCLPILGSHVSGRYQKFSKFYSYSWFCYFTLNTFTYVIVWYHNRLSISCHILGIRVSPVFCYTCHNIYDLYFC